MKSKATINWKGKETIRGLTENALELLRKLEMHKEAENLEGEYNHYKMNAKVFVFKEELEIVEKYVNVRL